MKKTKPSPDLRKKDPIEEKIEQRRRQILVHSYIYYDLGENIISDNQWTEWAKELYNLQNEHPDIAAVTALADEFKDFDYSTGFQLLYRQPWVIAKAEQLLEYERKKRNENNNT